MSRKEQIKILNDKIKSNVNQYKVDRLNAEISAFSSGDLNKYEFLTRKDLNYKPNALDKAKFGFSPLGRAFSMGLDKTAEGYQEEGVIKLLKDIRDGLAGGNRRDDEDDGDEGDDGDDGDGRNDGDNGDDEDDGNGGNDGDDKTFDVMNRFKNNMENNMENDINNLYKKVTDKENNLYAK